MQIDQASKRKEELDSVGVETGTEEEVLPPQSASAETDMPIQLENTPSRRPKELCLTRSPLFEGPEHYVSGNS